MKEFPEVFQHDEEPYIPRRTKPDVTINNNVTHNHLHIHLYSREAPGNQILNRPVLVSPINNKDS